MPGSLLALKQLQRLFLRCKHYRFADECLCGKLQFIGTSTHSCLLTPFFFRSFCQNRDLEAKKSNLDLNYVVFDRVLDSVLIYVGGGVDLHRFEDFLASFTVHLCFLSSSL